MANIVERPITEDGVVLEKKYSEAKDAFKMTIGGVEKSFDAKPEKYSVLVASSYEFDEKTGFKNTTILEYVVDKQIYDKLKYLSSVSVTYVMTSYKTTPLSLKIK